MFCCRCVMSLLCFTYHSLFFLYIPCDWEYVGWLVGSSGYGDEIWKGSGKEGAIRVQSPRQAYHLLPALWISASLLLNWRGCQDRLLCDTSELRFLLVFLAIRVFCWLGLSQNGGLHFSWKDRVFVFCFCALLYHYLSLHGFLFSWLFDTIGNWDCQWDRVSVSLPLGTISKKLYVFHDMYQLTGMLL